ncbi:hypothetical protein NKH75_30540 [Mesorhizobium sp. M0984]|uniref:hypothetical protein n=1 Tax=Mesorhizobium sp. M0984 TaxID=2957041 RepID=UPI0033366A49
MGRFDTLAAFLGRVTGITLIRDKLHRYRDRQRLEAFVARKTELVQAKRGAAHIQRERHRLQAVDGERTLKALAAVEKRELQSLEVKRGREQRIKDRAGHVHMPALTLELKPKGRGALVRKAQNRYKDTLRVPEERQARVDQAASPSIDLQQAMQDALAAQSPLSKAVDVRDGSRAQPMTGRAGTDRAVVMRARLPRSRSRGRRGVVSAGAAVMIVAGGRGKERLFFENSRLRVPTMHNGRVFQRGASSFEALRRARL